MLIKSWFKQHQFTERFKPFPGPELTASVLLPRQVNGKMCHCLTSHEQTNLADQHFLGEHEYNTVNCSLLSAHTSSFLPRYC